MDNSLGLEVNGSGDIASDQKEGNAVIGSAPSDATTDWNLPEGDAVTNDWANGANNTWGVDIGDDPAAASNDWNVPSNNDWGEVDEPTAGDAWNVSVDTTDKVKDGDSFGGDRGAGKSKSHSKSGKAGDGEGGKKVRAYVPAPVAPRTKLTEDELTERMEKIRLQNEKIKERREHVKADEEAFRTSMAAERARQEANRMLQAQINQNREQNAKRKLEKIGGREWDAGKQDGKWEKPKYEEGTNSSRSDAETRQGHRGRGKPFSARKEKGDSRSKLNSRRTPTPDSSAQDEKTGSQDIRTKEVMEDVSSPSDDAVRRT